MIELTLAQVAQATGGRLAAGTDPASRVSGSVTIDSRSIRAGDLFVALVGERSDGHEFAATAVAAGAVAVLAARPVGVPAVIVDDPVTALGLLARAVRDRLPGLVVIGITGSVGKTGTKDLMAAVLAGAGATIAPHGSFNNELGVPLTVLRADAATRYLIVEMGARGIGHIAYLCGIARPDVGVVLNVGSAHAGEFGSRQATARAKGELVESLPATGTAVLNADDPLVAAMADRTRAAVVFTGLGTPADVQAQHVRLDAQARAGFDLEGPAVGEPVGVQLRLHGEHQVPNALAVAAVALAVGLTAEQVAQGLSAAGEASRWRMELRRRADGLVVVNDAYNANPESMAAALRALVAITAGAPQGARSWAVLGEMLELGPDSAQQHGAIGRLAAELGVGGLIAVGPALAPLAAAASATSSRIEVLTAPGLPQALELTLRSVRSGDVVLVKASRSVGLERLAAGLLTEVQPDDHAGSPSVEPASAPIGSVTPRIDQRGVPHG